MRRDIKRLENGRIAWFCAKADEDFWSNHWRGVLTEENCAAYERGQLGPLEGAFTRNLSKDGRIVEAGCGVGQYVMALRSRGYEVDGVEWATETVKAVKRLRPGLPIRNGDVTKLDVPDGHYGAYISLGVMEHRRAGPEPFLREAYRVLRPGGIALVSVPFVHRLRALKAKLGLYHSDTAGRDFYQYAFTKEEFKGILERHGFAVRERIAYDAVKGLCDEVVGLPWLFARSRQIRLWDFVDRCGMANRLFGHMMLYVGVRTSEGRRM